MTMDGASDSFGPAPPSYIITSLSLLVYISVSIFISLFKLTTASLSLSRGRQSKWRISSPMIRSLSSRRLSAYSTRTAMVRFPLFPIRLSSLSLHLHIHRLIFISFYVCVDTCTHELWFVIWSCFRSDSDLFRDVVISLPSATVWLTLGLLIFLSS